ncbi:hypothetical protein HQN83_15935 [Pedobacter sp. LMG 31643]|nr:hypothetical protein [Pedobacter foliorum]NRF40216.1 hypothetical protein [Pedobacter foliorum]
MGQTVWANARKRYITRSLHRAYAAWESASHNTPSITCCIAKKIGIQASTRCAAVLALIMAILPTNSRPTPAAKLAGAEKHISYFFISEENSSGIK